MATLPYWNNGEVISSDKLNSMVASIIAGDPLAVKVSNATKNDVNQIVSYLSSLHDKAKTNLNSATSTSAFDTAYTNMTALVSNKLGAYANDDTVDLYSTGIRASIITFLQAYDTMMSSDRLNNKNTDNTLGGRIDSEANTRGNADNAINNKISDMQSNGGGRNLLTGTSGDWVTKTASGWMNVTTANSNMTSVADYHNGNKFTYSATVTNKSSFNVRLEMYCLDKNGTRIPANGGHALSDYVAPNTTAKRISCTITIDVNTRFVEHTLISDETSDSKTVQIKGEMFEVGTIAHDWSPAPEDTDDKVISLNDRSMQNRGTVNAPDFNSLTQAGYYTITGPGQGNNYPSSSWGTLEVTGQVADANGRLNQKYVSDSGGTIYTRQLNNDNKTWTAWAKVATQNDIDSVKDLANSKANMTDINWANVVANSSNTYNYASGSKITLPNNSSITINSDHIDSRIYLPTYFRRDIGDSDLNHYATLGEYDNAFVSSDLMANFANRPTNPDTNAPLTGDCFFTGHYAYSGTAFRAFQKIYSCDYNYVFIRSYNSSSQSWTNWSCLTPYA